MPLDAKHRDVLVDSAIMMHWLSSRPSRILTVLFLSALISGCGQDRQSIDTSLPAIYDFSDRLEYARSEEPWTVLDMGTAEAKAFFVDGWEKTPQHSGNILRRWAVSREPSVRFLAYRKEDLQLTFTCYPYSRSFPGQKVVVIINDQKVGTFKLTAGDILRDHTVDIPAALLVRGENRIVFKFRYNSRRHGRAACFSRLSLKGLVPPAAEEVTPLNGKTAGWRQPPSSRLCWRMVAPDTGYLTLRPSFTGSNNVDNACTVSFRYGKRRVTLAHFTTDPGREITVPFAAPNGTRGIIEFEVFGKSPVTWQKAIVGGRIDTRHANVFIFTVDSLRADHVGSYLYQRDTTPCIDELAKRGTLFEYAFTASNKSVPSHATILTGRYPQSHGIISNRDELDSQQLTLARILTGKGFKTSAHVNWRLLSLSSRTGNGFQKKYHVDGTTQKIDLAGRDNPYACAVQWIEEYWDQPLFSWIHSQYLHMTDFPADCAMRYVPPENVHTATALANAIAQKGTRDVFNAYEDNPDTLTPEVVSAAVALYDANLRFTDDHIAAFMERLKSFGLDPFSAVIITSDHGSHLGEGGQFGHLGTPHDHLIHVPLICLLPGCSQTPDRRVGGLVETVDIAPTVLSYLGLPVPRRMQGHDLMPLIRGEEDTGRDAAFAAVGRKGISMGYAIRTASWLYFFDSKEKERLINIDNDNGRLISLISQQPEKRKELRGILARWIDRTPVVGSGENAPISEEIRQMLIKGGYLEDAK